MGVRVSLGALERPRDCGLFRLGKFSVSARLRGHACALFVLDRAYDLPALRGVRGALYGMHRRMNSAKRGTVKST